MFKWLKRLLTKNETKVPLFYVSFNYKKYTDTGKFEFILALHPMFKHDNKIQTEIKTELINVIDLIRDNYEMGDL